MSASRRCKRSIASLRIICATQTAAEILGRGLEILTLKVGELAEVLIVDGNGAKDNSPRENPVRLIAVLQGGIIKAGQLA